MIARILKKPSKVFAGVKYNTNKVERNRGELMLTANFGALQALSNPRPQDLVNYLKMMAARNKDVSNPQFHAVLSASGAEYNKEELTKAAVLWLKEMGYGHQPYLLVFHKDTDNNHIHMVSSRIDRNGKQINRDFEKDRSLRSINKVLGYTDALKYSFSTRAQFYLIIESLGFMGRHYIQEEKLDKKIKAHKPDKARAAVLKDLFLNLRGQPDLRERLKRDYRIDLIFHASDGKKPYGYSVIDHDTRQAFKGSEILSLKYLLEEAGAAVVPVSGPAPPVFDALDTAASSAIGAAEAGTGHTGPAITEATYKGVAAEIGERSGPAIHIGPIYIANDVDDQQVLGMKRRRQKKARTNTR